MHINEITIMQRRNLGNYEHREVTLNMALSEKDDVQAAYESINESIKVALGYGEGAKNVQKTAEESKPEAQAEAAPAKPAKKVAKKATTKKKATKKANTNKPSEPVPTLDEMVGLCRDTANRLGDADKIKELITTACGVPSLKDADPSTYLKLKTLLGDA